MKAVGDFDFNRKVSTDVSFSPEGNIEEDKMDEFAKTAHFNRDSGVEGDTPLAGTDIRLYKPNIQGREWIVSDTDLSWISTGCYILGTGGGGSPYGHMLRLREIMKNGGVVRVISPEDLRDDDLVACGGGKGSPTVGIEKLTGDECVHV